MKLELLSLLCESEVDLRSLERYVRANPGDAGAAQKLARSRRRADKLGIYWRNLCRQSSDIWVAGLGLVALNSPAQTIQQFSAEVAKLALNQAFPQNPRKSATSKNQRRLELAYRTWINRIREGEEVDDLSMHVRRQMGNLDTALSRETGEGGLYYLFRGLSIISRAWDALSEEIRGRLFVTLSNATNYNIVYTNDLWAIVLKFWPDYGDEDVFREFLYEHRVIKRPRKAVAPVREWDPNDPIDLDELL